MRLCTLFHLQDSRLACAPRENHCSRRCYLDNVAPSADALLDFVLELQFENLPLAVVERARWVLADTVGCMLGGAATASGRTTVSVLSSLSGRDDATIIGTAQRADCVTAAFANSVLSDALDSKTHC